MATVSDHRYQILIDDELDEHLTHELEEIEVRERMDGVSEFRVRFAVDICGDSFLLTDDTRLVPGINRRFSVVVVVDHVRNVLVHGTITEREVGLKEGGPGSFLEVRGQDRRVEMDRDCDRYRRHSGSVDQIVQGIFGFYGFEADVESGNKTVYDDDSNTLSQTDSDLKLVEKLAGQEDVYFWIDWEANGRGNRVQIVETAHFKSVPARGEGATTKSRPTLVAPPDAARLTLNTGDGKNTLLEFQSKQKSEVPRATGTIFRVDVDRAKLDKTAVPEPSQAPLGERPPGSGDLKCSVVSAGNAERAHRQAQAALNDASWSIEASARSTLHALGALVRPREVVTVSGTGVVDDGSYLVWAVTHTINPADHWLSMDLRRNATGG